VVTRLDWANPHAHILMDVVEGNNVTNWAVELKAPSTAETLSLDASLGTCMRRVIENDRSTTPTFAPQDRPLPPVPPPGPQPGPKHQPNPSHSMHDIPPGCSGASSLLVYG
jgi:hypothetical protein